jgi:GT2 family glycosyltransferase
VQKGRTFFEHLGQRNEGLSGAHPLASSMAFGDFILPLDADDIILHEDYIKKTLPILVENELVGMVSLPVFFQGEKEKISGIYEHKPHEFSHHSLMLLRMLQCNLHYTRKSYLNR